MARGMKVYAEWYDNRVVGAYCSRDCAETRRGNLDGIRVCKLPRGDSGLTGYALALLSCDECGDNLADLADGEGER